ncbi:hypothetical protein EYF80_032527 [Liparis tanakae]|uniref:Uncharacterized protein n=1 Tax=Liparis tanakae TaxID=230148 RepID=A0A4Z2GUJ1_9TELE|nr:hypothetical protein EYF80_032527 [Liparis tanakae]
MTSSSPHSHAKYQKSGCGEARHRQTGGGMGRAVLSRRDLLLHCPGFLPLLRRIQPGSHVGQPLRTSQRLVLLRRPARLEFITRLDRSRPQELHGFWNNFGETRGEGLREEDGDEGSGELSEESQFRLEDARAGDGERRMTEGLSLSSVRGGFSGRGEMTSPAAGGRGAVQGLDGGAGGAGGAGARWAETEAQRPALARFGTERSGRCPSLGAARGRGGITASLRQAASGLLSLCIYKMIQKSAAAVETRVNPVPSPGYALFSHAQISSHGVNIKDNAATTAPEPHFFQCGENHLSFTHATAINGRKQNSHEAVSRCRTATDRVARAAVRDEGT